MEILETLNDLPQTNDKAFTRLTNSNEPLVQGKSILCHFTQLSMTIPGRIF